MGRRRNGRRGARRAGRPAGQAGQAIGSILVDGIVRNTNRAQRQRLAGLVQTLLCEAEQLGSSRAALPPSRR